MHENGLQMISQPCGHVLSHSLPAPFESRVWDLFVTHSEPQKMVTLGINGDVTHLTHLPTGSFCVTVVSTTRKGRRYCYMMKLISVDSHLLYDNCLKPVLVNPPFSTDEKQTSLSHTI